MKRVISLWGLLLITSAFYSVHAQDAYKFGIKAGFLTTSISSPDDTYGLRPGYSIGAFFEYNVLDILGVSIEPAFTMKGSNDIDPLTIYDPYSPKLYDYLNQQPYSFKQHNLSYSTIELPLLVSYKLKLGGGMDFKVFGGSSIDFILKGTHYAIQEGVTVGESWLGDSGDASDITNRLSAYDVTGIIGLGTDFEVGDIDLSIDLRYQRGFADINNVAGKPNLNSNCFALTVGVGLNKLFLK